MLAAPSIRAKTSHAQSSDPTTQPRLQVGDITYLGFFNVPRPGQGSAANSFDYGGMGLALGADGASLYYGGHVYNQSLGRVSIPSGFGGTATLIQAPVSIPGDVGTGTTELAGALVWNNRLIVTKRIPYDNFGSGSTHAVGNLNISGFSSFYRMANLNSAQFANGYMGVIPPEWRPRLGGPAFAGNGVMSINSLCTNGPSFFVFNPDDVGVVTSIPSVPLMYYPLSNPLANPNAANDLFSRSDRYNAGIVFPSGTRSVLFIHRHGYGNPTYKLDDGCGGISGEGGAPYRRQVTAFDANDLLAVKNGTKQPYQVQPYAFWTLPGPSESCAPFGGYANGSYCLAYDQATRRIYAVLDPGEQPRVHVWQVAGGSPSPKPSAPTNPSAQ